MSDADTARELFIWISNDSDSYGAVEYMARNYERKRARGVYDSALASKGLAYAVERGARNYARSHCASEREWSIIFPPAIRRIVADQLRNHLESEWAAGNYWSI